MPTRFDPFTGEPLDVPQGAQQPLEGDDEESLVVSGEERQQGTIYPGETQQENRFGMAVAVPLVIVALVSPVVVGLFAILLGARGTLEAAPTVLVPALIVGGVTGAVLGVAASFYLWPATERQGPLRTIAYGALASAVVLAVLVLLIGLVFA